MAGSAMATNRGTAGWRRREAKRATAARRAEREADRALSAEALELVAYWRERIPDPQFIYFAQEEGPGAGDAVKIGTAADPLVRIADLQCGNPRRLRVSVVLLGDALTERTLHRVWASQRVQGEWFDGAEAIIVWVRAAAKRQMAEHEAEPDNPWAPKRVGRWAQDERLAA